MSLADQLEPIIREHFRQVRDAAEERVIEALINAAPDGPPREGGGIKLKQSIRGEAFERGDTLGTVVSADAEHAEMVSEGTRPHVIRPVSAKALRFVTFGGETVFAKHVDHPGTSPNTYFEDTTARWGEFLQAAIFDR